MVDKCFVYYKTEHKILEFSQPNPIVEFEQNSQVKLKERGNQSWGLLLQFGSKGHLSVPARQLTSSALRGD